MLLKTILIIHMFSSLFMCGLCWFVQIVHYPLFRAIPISNFENYERKNGVTAFITVPLMTIELISGLFVLYMNFSKLFLLNMLLLALIWLSTLIYQVPLHLKLMLMATPERITKVIRTNWIRTISWTLRACILAYILIEQL